MKLIGTQLYQHLLSRALRKARGDVVERWSPELNIGDGGFLPDSWIPEPDVRLGLYVRLSRLDGDAELEAFEEGLLDRFGPLPISADRLLTRARVRVAARSLGIARIDAGPAAIALTPRSGVEISGEGLVEKESRLILAEASDEATRIERVQALLESIAA